MSRLIFEGAPLLTKPGVIQALGAILHLSSFSHRLRRLRPPSARQREAEQRSLAQHAGGADRPPCHATMRRTFASPTPVPSNSRSSCGR